MCSATHTRQLVGTHTIESSTVRSREVHPSLLSLSGQTPALSQLLTSHISPQFGLVSVVFNHQYSSSPIRLDTSSHRQTNTQQYKTPAKLKHLTSSLPCMWARVRSPHKRVPPSDVTLKKWAPTDITGDSYSISEPKTILKVRCFSQNYKNTYESFANNHWAILGESSLFTFGLVFFHNTRETFSSPHCTPILTHSGTNSQEGQSSKRHLVAKKKTFSLHEKTHKFD